MRKQLLLLGMLLALTSCSTPRKLLSVDEVFSKRFEHKMISSGPNFPDFYSKKDSMDLFLVALHEQIPVTTFQNKAGWSNKELETNTQFLIDKNWLVDSEGLKPTVFIATDTQGKSLFSYSTPVALEIFRSIEEELHTIKNMYSTTALSKKHSFEELSFFILSNVLLDNWQINNVESEFLKTDERPQRHGKNYYYAIMENANYPKEDFGIYGNQYNSVNDSTAIAIYGNNRNEGSKQLKDKIYFAGLLQEAPRINKADNAILDSMAEYYKPKLMRVLVKNSEYIINVYEKSGYDQEISFEEFFIWWYHFIYTQATDMLADEGLLKIPDSGNFFYIVEQ